MAQVGAANFTRPLTFLALDDDPLTLDSLRVALQGEGQFFGFTRPEEAETFLETRAPHLALLDLNFPSHSGIALLQKWRERFPSLPIVSCSGEVRVERAIECLRVGASDYLGKPFRQEDLLRVVRRTLEKHRLQLAVRAESPRPQNDGVTFVGNSAPVRELMSQLRLLRNQTHLNVLILGESGTGKEVVARLLHAQENVSERPFIVANMPAIPTTLLESEFFGVEKGAYTDAKASRPGKFELADNGDIFLDEIGDLQLETQAKILRVLQERQVERVGATVCRRVNFRTIAATNRPLSDLIAGGRFREDLMYRLSDMVLWLPSLRERMEDLPLLVSYFTKKYRPKAPPEISSEALAKLAAYHWPGNVRQLESTIKRAIVFCEGSVLDKVEIIDPTTLSPNRLARELAGQGTYDSQMQNFERLVIGETLRRNGGDREAAIRELKLSKATFYRKINQLGILLS